MLFKPTPRKNNIIKRNNYISFLKNDTFNSYKMLAGTFSIVWGLLAFTKLGGGIFTIIAVILTIASLGAFFYIPQLAKKHQKDQFVIEYQFGVHDVTENFQKRIPWADIVCFVNSYELIDRKKNVYESTFYLITRNDYIKLDNMNFTDEQLQVMYGLLGPYLNSYQRYIQGEKIIKVEMRDINRIRENFTGQKLYLK